jgi:hypothetical protein
MIRAEVALPRLMLRTAGYLIASGSKCGMARGIGDINPGLPTPDVSPKCTRSILVVGSPLLT